MVRVILLFRVLNVPPWFSASAIVDWASQKNVPPLLEAMEAHFHRMLGIEEAIAGDTHGEEEQEKQAGREPEA